MDRGGRLGEFVAALKGRTTLAVFERRDWQPAGSIAKEFIRNIPKMVWHRPPALRKPAWVGRHIFFLSRDTQYWGLVSHARRRVCRIG